MFKKLFIATAILAISSNVFAAQTGYYKGDSGAISTNNSCEQSDDCPINSPYIGADIGARYNYSDNTRVFEGYTGNVALGYGYASAGDAVYLGGELFGQDTAVLRNYTAIHGDSLRSTWDYGISVLPGFFVATHTILFGRLGAVRTHFVTIEATKWGTQLGVGTLVNVAPHWDIRGEFDYTKYTKISGGTPQSTQVLAGIAYRIF